MDRRITLTDRDVEVYTDGSDEALRANLVRFMALMKQARDAIGTEAVDVDSGEVTRRLFRLVFAQVEDDRSLLQNRAYWGPVLGTISREGVLAGQRFSAEAWHEHFRREFLGFEIVKVEVAGRKRKQVIRRLRSTTRLSVRQMSVYLEQIMAFASTDLGLVIEIDPDMRKAISPPRKARKVSRQLEAIAA